MSICKLTCIRFTYILRTLETLHHLTNQCNNRISTDVRAVEGSNVTLEFKFDNSLVSDVKIKKVHLRTPLSRSNIFHLVDEYDLRRRAEIGCLDAVSNSKCGEPIRVSGLYANVSGDFDRSTLIANYLTWSFIHIDWNFYYLTCRDSLPNVSVLSDY